MHATPIAGHMGEYKTLYRIRLRFFWPRMRSNIKEWIQQCHHCMVIYSWRRRGQEFMFSWLVRFPFAILHLDVWMLEYHIDSNGNIALMNSMCDTSQFVVVVPVHDETSATLADHSGQHVLINLAYVTSL